MDRLGELAGGRLVDGVCCWRPRGLTFVPVAKSFTQVFQYPKGLGYAMDNAASLRAEAIPLWGGCHSRSPPVEKRPAGTNRVGRSRDSIIPGGWMDLLQAAPYGSYPCRWSRIVAVVELVAFQARMEGVR